MKTKLFTIVAALTIIAAITAISSCQKEKVTPVTRNIKGTTASTKLQNQQAYGKQAIYDIVMIAQSVSSSGNLAFKKENFSSLLGTCGGVTNDTVSNPHTCTIDFGVLGCVCGDGRIRAGQVIFTYTNNDVRQPGNSFDITTNNFSVDTNAITGSLHVVNTGLNVKGNLEFSIVSSTEIQVVFHDGSGTLHMNWNQVGEWLAGESTTTNDDDVYGFTGSTFGSLADGSTGVDTIEAQLVRTCAPGCTHNFIQGQELIQIQGNPDKLIDYGDGTCSAVATQTVSGVTTPYNFPKGPF